MRLAPRLVLAFGFVAAVSTAGLGAVIREQRVQEETASFDREVRSACLRVRDEVARQASSDRKLLSGACDGGELVDRTLVAIEAGELDDRRVALAALVPGEREAFDLDELLLLTDRGEVLGADPREGLGLPASEVVSLVRTPPEQFLRGAKGMSGLVARCRKQGQKGRSVALVGVRHMGPLLARLGKTANVDVTSGGTSPSEHGIMSASCLLADPSGATLTLTVGKSRGELEATLDRIDRTVLLSAALATVVAFLLAVLLARSLGRPIAELAAEARKVAAGEARPVGVRGTGEIADLSAAFDKMIEDLEGTRRRLAATSRVAAWREVARRVAHEVKNPLAPIRAAVETLRRLRARSDPAFDEYFDEATRTVLDEVHRIADIVTEFTRFARLPPPRPQEVDLAELARSVVSLHKGTAKGTRLDVVVAEGVPPVLADKDQIVQVLTNLVQNALDALADRTDGAVRISIAKTKDASSVAIEVNDNGPGLAKEIAARLFEPYATSKKHGTGLGLAIAQRIAIEHGGELSFVPPREGHAGGTVFRLVLPIEGPPPVSEMPADTA